ncbi:MAG TPA: hypothetical protein DEO70_14435 [Bacteroidales bacterium]|nr:MAG: hypothetical protein A2X11_13245 [Bacteroidetes bacterium GWE2_42_24]OFY26764.1 MAG: hypothetical protein A2X09_10185 [Bacteroidetes bacterium GWF2_43_11]HBZ68029.1 hypothetical protein [Bacteroidales bacterium]
MKQNIDIEGLRIEHTVSILNILEADEYILLTKTRCAHRNVSSEDLSEFHIFINEQSNAINQIVEEVEEKVFALGQTRIGSLKEFLDLTHLAEQKQDYSNSIETTQNLIEDHESIVNFLKDVLKIPHKPNDFAESAFLADVLGKHEIMILELKAFISKKKNRSIRVPENIFKYAQAN